MLPCYASQQWHCCSSPQPWGSTAPTELEGGAAWAAGASCCHHGKPRGAVRSCPLQIRVLGKEASDGSLHLPDTQGSKSLSKGLIHHLNTGVSLQRGQEAAVLRDDTRVSFCPREVMDLELCNCESLSRSHRQAEVGACPWRRERVRVLSSLPVRSEQLS